jgi:pyruvate dehydrogenase (quinone)
MENHGARTSTSWLPYNAAPSAEQLQDAADILNSGQRVAILAGQVALAARAELGQIAEILGAPVAKALLGRSVMADDSPFSTGGIGHLGTAPSSWTMETCDTLLILGSTMPWIDFYPRPGQARGVQVDVNPDRIGLRHPVELGLVGAWELPCTGCCRGWNERRTMGSWLRLRTGCTNGMLCSIGLRTLRVRHCVLKW